MLTTGKVDHLMGERQIKLECVLDYNLKPGTVDKVDMMLYGMHSENDQEV
jgi:hypothetical protein